MCYDNIIAFNLETQSAQTSNQTTLGEYNFMNSKISHLVIATVCRLTLRRWRRSIVLSALHITTDRQTLYMHFERWQMSIEYDGFIIFCVCTADTDILLHMVYTLTPTLQVHTHFNSTIKKIFSLERIRMFLIFCSFTFCLLHVLTRSCVCICLFFRSLEHHTHYYNKLQKLKIV